MILGKNFRGKKTEKWLFLQKISVSFGIVGVIYESRPNVTIEIPAICLKAGNTVVLKGGEEAERSNKILVELIKDALKKVGFSENLVLRIPEKERQLVSEILKAINS
jgi:glutamate-5-semialdehyde dehydrogenase